MKKTMTKALAFLLVLVQLVTLLPVLQPQVKAEGETPSATTEPKLNHMYAGTVQFGAFHNSKQDDVQGKDGADYVIPYVYTDDYFALPSYSDELASKTLLQKDINYTSYSTNKDGDLSPTQHTGKLYTRSLLWTDIESTSLATASMDFVMASFGSNEQNDDTDNYNNYSKNGEEFLQNIGFASSDITVNNEFNQLPGLDTIGVVIGSKPIEVYNPSTKTNDGYTLVAIGIRGGGYGAEWGSNLTLGSGVDSLEHQGFREATDEVIAAVNEHIANHSAQFAEGTKVKYWIVGYSRSGAVANLVAGDITDAAASYNTTAKDIYAYTFEAAAGAAATREPSDTATNYPNIHNILNQLDPVPYVSTQGMGNIRLGINYLTPYYGNTKSQAQNTGYYENMHDILETVAQGYYGQDAIITQAKPGSLADGEYPMDGKIVLHKFDILKAVTQSSTYPMGLLPYDDWKGGLISNATGSSGNYVIPMEYFLYQVVDEFFGSRAWDYNASKLAGKWELGTKWTYQYDNGNDEYQLTNTDQMTHRKNYATLGNYNLSASMHNYDVKNPGEQQGAWHMTYEQAIRYLIEKTMAEPGSKLADVFDGFSTKLFTKLSALGTSGGFYLSITSPAGGYDAGNNENRASIVDSHMRAMLYTILQEGKVFKDTSYTYRYRVCGDTKVAWGDGSKQYDKFNISLATGEAVGALSPVLSRMFLYDRNAYGSQYLGTLLKYGLNTIIVNHVPEVVVSWQMAMDENYISDYRKITLPSNTNVAMYLFRDGIDEPMLDSNVPEAIAAKGVKVAEVNAGTFNRNTCADDRINVTDNGNGTFTIFYPGSVDYRFDVTTVSQTDAIQDVSLTLADFQPKNGVNVKATYDRASNGNVIANTRALDYDSMLEQHDSTSATSINTYAGSHDLTLQPNQTLHVMAWSGSNAPGAEQDTQYAIELTTAKTQLADFGTVTISEDAATGHVYKAESGTFANTGDDVTYSLNQKTDDEIANSKFFAPYDTVDVADAAKTNHDGTLYLTDHVSVVPASSVYFDDNLNGQTFTSDGHGYSSDIDDAAVSKSATAAPGTFYYTFYGTGIDAYVTTDGESGYVSAAVFHTDDPNACSKDNRVGKAVTVSNKSSEGTRYNTPTISFMNLGEADVYTLKINANDNAKFKLDGVRVYNPVMATDDKGNTTAAAAKQAEVGEGNTLYVNLHEMLVNTGTDGFSVVKPTDLNGDFDKSTISGVLFVDNAANLATESHYVSEWNEETKKYEDVWQEEAVTLYQTQFDAYKNNSPNNEIYLAAKTTVTNEDQTTTEKTQAITFQINVNKLGSDSKVYIGLSAPELDKTKNQTASVQINGTDLDPQVNSVMDMYYPVPIDLSSAKDGAISITVTNTGDTLISITNLKITNVPEAKGILSMSAPDRSLAMRAFFAPVTTETVELAAAPEAEPAVVDPEPTAEPDPEPTGEPDPQPTDTPDPEPTTEPEPEPTPDTPDDPTPGWNDANNVVSLLQNVFRSLLRGIGNLFRGIGGW